MNSHARTRLYESTVLILEGLIATEGRTITVPEAVARNIKALAYDLTKTVARKAQLNVPVTAVGEPHEPVRYQHPNWDPDAQVYAREPSPQWQTGPTRINGEVVT